MIENHLRKPVGFCRNSRIAKFLVEAASGLLHCSEMEACSGPGKCRKGSAGHFGIKCERNACGFNSRLNRESTEREDVPWPCRRSWRASIHGSTERALKAFVDRVAIDNDIAGFNSRLNRESTERAIHGRVRALVEEASIHGSTERALKELDSSPVCALSLASIHGSTERALKELAVQRLHLPARLLQFTAQQREH